VFTTPNQKNIAPVVTEIVLAYYAESECAVV